MEERVFIDARVTKTQRGCPLLQVGGYQYTERSDAQGSWRCRTRGCPGRAKVANSVVKLTVPHDHAPDYGGSALTLVKKEIRERSSVLPAERVYAALQKHTSE